MQLVDQGDRQPGGPGAEARLTLAVANARRRALLASLTGRVELAFGGSKLHLGPLSPGCQRCGHGLWSCMFLNRACGAGCFFCPDQDAMPSAPPQAERIVFPSAEAYAAYVDRLGFGGVSFSGGEPFAAPDRLVEHIEALRSRCGDRVYLWAYTSGRGVSREALRRVATAGLQELRFNLVASDYTLGPLRRALGLLERVTVEIPAVPEHAERLRTLLPELQRLGVAHGNLHGLIGAGTNGARLLERGYTLTGGPTPLVVESELSALETLRWALDNGVQVPIQYCGLAFKQRWQNRVEDLRAAEHVLRPGEELTETGCLRRLTVAAPPDKLRALQASLSAWPEAAGRWELAPDGAELTLAAGLVAGLWPGRAGSNLGAEEELAVSYSRTVLGAEDPLAAERHFPGYSQLQVQPGLTLGLRRIPISERLPLTLEQALALAEGAPPDHLRSLERIPAGLPDYRP